MEKIILNSKPSTVQMENGLLRITGILLAPGVWNKNRYLEEELARAKLPDVTKKPVKLTKNHGDSIEDDIGVFTKIEHSDKGIAYEAYIDDPDTIRRITNRMETLKKLGLPAENAFEISSELYGERVFDSKLKEMVIRDIALKRASLVLDGACSPPNCTVNPELNSERVENATKCEQQYMTPDMQRFKKGWDGCIEAMKVCRGFDKKRATAMCNYIFWRRHRDEDFSIIKLLEELNQVEDVDSFVEKLRGEYLEDIRKGFIEYLEKYPWDECVRDQMKRYGDRETAEKICGYIRCKIAGKCGKKQHKEDEEVIKMAEDKIEELFSDFIREKLGMKDVEELDDNPSEVQEELENREEIASEETEKVVENKEETDTPDDEIEKLREELREYKLTIVEEILSCECLKGVVTKEELMEWDIKQLKALAALQRGFKEKLAETRAKRATYHNSEAKTENGVSFEDIFKI